MGTETQISRNDAVGVRTITLDRPSKANSLSADVVEELLAHLDAAAAEHARVVVFKSSGKNFCAGFDFSNFEEQSDGDLLHRFVRIEELLQAIRYAPFVTIACVHGAAYGAGADILGSCTYRIGAPGVRIRFPGFQFGVSLGTRHLARVVGTSVARDILLKNLQLDADRALSCGLLTQLVETSEFDSTVQGIVAGLSPLGTVALESLLNNTLEITRNADMADLVRSVSTPGLRERIARYRMLLMPKLESSP